MIITWDYGNRAAQVQLTLLGLGTEIGNWSVTRVEIPLTATAATPWESLKGLAPTVQVPWETKFTGLTQSKSVPYESLKSLSKAGIVPYEMPTRIPAPPLRVEAGAGFSAGAVAGVLTNP